jgi:predicted  nucleic acid-binding Zn-ribbon protein
MSTLLALAALALSAVAVVRLRRREQLLSAEVAALGERVRDVTERVEAAQADVAHAVTQSGITESLLVDKGIADEEEIEALRRRFDEDEGEGEPPYEPERDGGLH